MHHHNETRPTEKIAGGLVSSTLFVDKLKEDAINANVSSDLRDELVDKIEDSGLHQEPFESNFVPKLEADTYDDFIKGQLNENVLDIIYLLCGDNLSKSDVIAAVHQASDFFNLNYPAEIREDWATGVICRIHDSESDDILVFNKEQLRAIGISDKEGLDLVMTHEGAHRCLQRLETGFTSHQEELCCDFMAGVRAGLNDMDENKFVNALRDTIESDTHPDGISRALSIETGAIYAQDYYFYHNKEDPSFNQCLSAFKSQIIECDDISKNKSQINLKVEKAEYEAPNHHV